jgi:hypothetical protein
MTTPASSCARWSHHRFHVDLGRRAGELAVPVAAQCRRPAGGGWNGGAIGIALIIGHLDRHSSGCNDPPAEMKAQVG